MWRALAALTASITLVGTPGFAADMAVKAAPPIAGAPAPSWTGLYAGITAGYGWGTSRQYDPIGSSTNPYNIDGAVGGIELGYNWQINQIVLGAEVDFSVADIAGSGATTPTWGCGGVGCNTDVLWFATQRARAGYLLTNSLLAYGTAGAAEVRVENSIPPCAVPGFFGCVTTANTRTGWTAGGGLEYQFASHATVKVEYLFVDIGQFQWTTFLAGTDPGLTYARFNVVRVGLNYKF